MLAVAVLVTELCICVAELAIISEAACGGLDVSVEVRVCVEDEDVK